ncbi:MAG: hypothetical protein J3Q66DRAFT_390844 [Benniella sp.]|nr:MAG: hypothetical protein J3Q66DRAFT_390844 [Benniella sp.]
MFDIPELDDMVCRQLRPQDLAQFARVNKKWHTVVIPYLWKDLSCLNASSSTQRQAFTSLLLEDYLQEQRETESQKDGTGTEQAVQAQLPSPSALAKYGCWIRILPDPKGLVQLSDDSTQLVQALTGHDNQSIEQELLLHFFKCHQEAQLPHYSLEYDTLGSSPLKETVAQLVLPRVRHLSVEGSYRGKRGELWKLKRLLGRCSTTLEKLTLEIDYKYDDGFSTYVGYDPDFKAEEEEPETTESTEWPSLKELVLCPRECVGTPQPTTFWSWLYERCGQVERIEVSKFRRGAAECIRKDMLKHMPNLNGITIGDGTGHGSTIKPDRVRSLLSGSRNGWKTIVLRMPVKFMFRSRGAIREHFPTIEVIRMDPVSYQASELIEMLSSSPNLHTFCGIAGRMGLNSNAFVDRDPDTSVLKTWLCESSLKVLKVGIGHIPRPELEGYGVTEEAHPGQGREIQNQVYDRLARLTNLETLSLGDIPEEVTLSWSRGVRIQRDCLEMSLESGLHKLSELTKLKELNVLGMKARIGIGEVQWMTEHWPRLRVLRGLDEINKKWQAVVIPYLWKDLSCLNASSSAQRQAFTSLLLEDYLQEQRKAESQKGEAGTEQPVQAQLPSSSALAKYGCWIRILPDPKGLVQLSDDSTQLVQALTEHDNQSIEQDLLLHFFKRHQEAQLPQYSLDYDTLGSSPLKETVAQLVLPRVRRLTVVGSYRGKRGELWKLKRLLGRCSTALQKLTLEIDYLYGDSWSSYVDYDEDFDAEEEEPETTESTEWSSLKELILRPRRCAGSLQPTMFWSWLYKRCSQVERIEVSKFRRGAAESIAENMLEYMPNLNEITIGHGGRRYSTIKPDRVSSLLSASRNGWKVIVLTAPVNLFYELEDTMQRHFPTLEVLRITCDGIHDVEFVEMLSSCPNLHTFHGIFGRSSIQGDIFIDRDPDTSVLKTWSCETSLKVLKVDIGHIPRPDLKGVGVIDEEHPGQGREIQGLVYDRLARLTNLETLSLGDIPEETTYYYRQSAIETQFDCLEMSLESGLHKLSELTKLSELNVLGMKTRIGVKEVQWMTKHWPRLRVLRGLDESDDETNEVVQWLQEHHPEIDLIRDQNRQLRPQDLAQFARVNKKWHTVVIPYLWGDLSCLNTSSSAQRQAFTSLLLEDYLQEQQKTDLQKDETGTEQPVQAQLPSPSALAKYGCWIRSLPDPTGLVQLSDDSMQLAKALTRQDSQSTEQELLLRFFKIHQAAQLPHYSLEYDTLESNHPKETIAQLVLPRVRHLTIVGSYRGKRGELWKLKRLLSLCSTTLEKLTLEITYKYDDDLSVYVGYDPDFKAEEEEPNTTSSTEWSSLKELVLRPSECVGILQPTTFWSWFYKRCSQVERIAVSKFCRGAAEGITENMLAHMPNLNEITVGGSHGSTIKPERIASLLSGSRNGWKVIDLKMPVNFFRRVGDSIQKHSPTLEVLRISCFGVPGDKLVEVFSSSPHLHTFHGVVERTYIKSNLFIDQDPDTGVLKTWSCENSLKVLKVSIGDIPRPELEGTTKETHPGQGREIQGLVYDRLARLTNLETLSLGDTPDEEAYRRGRPARNQSDCVEMSLESGLHKLSELTKLRELNVLGMKARIGIKEVQWMTEHWPRLRVLRGLDGSDDGGKQVVQWLQQHHPEIDLMRAPIAGTVNS